MKKVKVEITHYGEIAEHNLLCWLCNKRDAVCEMIPEWVFKPCEVCQALIKAEEHKLKVNRLANAIMKFYGQKNTSN